MIYRINTSPGTEPLALKSSQDAVKSRIEKLYDNEQASLIEKLKKIDHVSTCLKVICFDKLKFVGMTVHWIEPDTFQQVYHILCVKRLNSCLTIDQVTSIVSSTNERFAIQNKVVGIVASNMIDNELFFKTHGITFDEGRTENLTNGIPCDDINMSNEFLANNENLAGDFQIKCLENLSLPGQYQSACELLRLVLMVDAQRASTCIFRSSMQKLNHLFRLLRCDATRETMKTTYQISIEPPVAAQWQSLYYVIQNVVQHDVLLINRLMVDFHAPEFTCDEYEFLTEYACVMGPLADALDNLQSNGLYATLLPTLRTLRDGLQLSQNRMDLKFCAPLAKTIYLGFMERFSDFFDISSKICVNATIAACVHPYFKLRWIDAQTIDQSYFDKITDLIVSAASKCIRNSTNHQLNTSQISKHTFGI